MRVSSACDRPLYSLAQKNVPRSSITNRSMRLTRRKFVRYVAGGLPVALAGCIARPGDPITMLAVNQDDTSHSVTVWAVQGGTLTVENTVEVAGKDVEKLGQMPWKAAQPRHRVRGCGGCAR